MTPEARAKLVTAMYVTVTVPRKEIEYHIAIAIERAVEEERESSVQAVMDLFYALKDIGGRPTLKDLVKLAKRIRARGKSE